MPRWLFALCLLFSAQGFAQGGAASPALEPYQVIQSVEQPWSGPLLDLQKTMKPGKNYIFWINVPAEHPMDLRSSDHFRQWTIATPLTEVSISHNMVAWNCTKRDGEHVMGATGMTGGHAKQEASLFLKGYGMSVFTATMLDGHLNPQKEVGQYIMENLRNRGAIFAGFEITPEQCSDMQDFLMAFVYHPSRPYTKFGLLPDPENMEGGGCVTFASALMKRAGVLNSVIPSFYRTVYGARYLFGGNLGAHDGIDLLDLPWLNGKRRSVSLIKLQRNPWDQAPANFPGFVPITLMDPEKMTYTLKQFSNIYLEQFPTDIRESEASYLARTPLGLRTVVTGEYNNYDQTGQIDYSYSPVDDTYDDQMAQIGADARDWFRDKLRDGFHIRRDIAAGMPVLLLETN